MRRTHDGVDHIVDGQDVESILEKLDNGVRADEAGTSGRQDFRHD